MIKWALGLAFLLLGVEMSYAQQWINTNATTRSFRIVSSTHEYPIAPGLTVSGSLSNGDIIYVAVVGGSDSSDTIISPTYNTPYFLATLATVNAIAPTSWGTGTVAIQSITLNAVLKITVRQAASVDTVTSFLRQLSLKTMGYRQDKTIAFILDRTGSPEWRCFNARTVNMNFNIQCSTTHVTATSPDADNGIDPQDLVSFSPNEFLAFASSSSPRASNTCPLSTYEKELHSTTQTMAQSNQILQFSPPSTFSLSPQSGSGCSSDNEHTTANQDIDPSTIYARMVIMRPNPFLHAQPF